MTEQELFCMDVDEIVTCEMCSGEFAWEECFMGVLGALACFRCRGCGWQWSIHEEDQ